MTDTLAAIATLTKLKKALPTRVLAAIDNVISDQIDRFRADNLYKILQKAEGKITVVNDRIALNPKLIMRITESGSLEGDPDLQDMWAGLIASAGVRDTNLHFVEILENLTQFQAKLLKKICSTVEVKQGDLSLIYVQDEESISLEEIYTLAETRNITIIDTALDDLRRKGLIDGGFHIPVTDKTNVRVQVLPLALNFYAAVSGSEDPLDFYKAQITKAQEEQVLSTNLIS